MERCKNGHQRTPENTKVNSRGYTVCTECARVANRKWRDRRFDQAYLRLFEEQDGVCAICGEPETAVLRGRTLKLSVDHDHETGVIRGLLCHACNLGLGKFKDRVELLEKAIAYLED